jgi:hypothetical protein
MRRSDMDDLPTYSSAASVALYSGSEMLMVMKHMRDSMEGSEELLCTDLGIELYIQGRNDPVHGLIAVAFLPAALPQSVEELTDYVTQVIMERMDSKSTYQIVIENQAHTKMIVTVDRIDSLTVLAPEALPQEFQDALRPD